MCRISAGALIEAQPVAAADLPAGGTYRAAPAYGGGSRPPQDGFRVDAANWQQETPNLRITGGKAIAQLAFRP